MSRRHDPAAQQQQYRDDARQMGQYAQEQRQHGDPSGPREDARNWGAAPRRESDLTRHDPVQASYGRAGAPDVHRAPSGGYERDHDADAGYNRPGYMRNPEYQGHGSQDRRHGGGYGGYAGHERSGYRNQSQRYEDWRPGPYEDHGPGYMGTAYDEARDWQRRHSGGETHSYGRFQGGAGGYRSNAGPYAGSQTYGGYGDQLGYGSAPDQQGQHHQDPDYHQWREQQLRKLDEDYASWRGERYKRFSDDFESWRRGRQTQQPAGQAGPGGDASGTPEDGKPPAGDKAR